MGAWELLLVVLGRTVWGMRWEQVALGMVPGVLAGLMAWRVVVALAALPAMLAHMSVTVGVRPGRGDKGYEGCCSCSGLITRKCAATPPQPE